uniref:Uncharacterized protein n=1 Tax=Anguilla anguilla TaxID=7936 RepID=A0A0E9SHX4_ANGAN
MSNNMAKSFLFLLLVFVIAESFIFCPSSDKGSDQGVIVPIPPR